MKNVLREEDKRHWPMADYKVLKANGFNPCLMTKEEQSKALAVISELSRYTD
jgi:hypothetical protein